MKESQKQKNKILKMIRRLRGTTLQELHKKAEVALNLLSFYETGKAVPTRETAIKISKGLEVDPDILLLSFGYFPENEMNIVKDDPYYYLDKIQKMCKNHATRYPEENTNIDDLNIARTYDYIIKSMEHQKNENKGNT